MKAWVRVVPTVSSESAEDSPKIKIECEASLRLLVYPSEQAARESAQKFGGLVVEMNLRELRGTTYSDVGYDEITDPGEAYVQELADRDPLISIIARHKRDKDERGGALHFENQDEEAWALDTCAAISGMPQNCPACGGTEFELTQSTTRIPPGRGLRKMPYGFVCPCGKRAALEELWAEEDALRKRIQ
jgi:hypothetical protein